MKACFVLPCNIPHRLIFVPSNKVKNPLILYYYPKVNKGHIIMLHRKLGRFPVSQSPVRQEEGVPPRSSEQQPKL